MGGLELTWLDPADSDLAGIRIRWEGGPSVTVAPGVQQHRITGLEGGARISVQIVAADKAGNLSPAITAEGGPLVAPYPGELLAGEIVAADARVLRAPDGSVSLAVPAGTFAAPAALTITRLTEPAIVPGEGYKAAYSHSFPDLAGHWSQADVEVMASRHLVHGVSVKAFKPDRPITRAEFTKLMVQMLLYDAGNQVSLPASGSLTFRDVSPDDWFYSYVETAAWSG